MKYEVVSVISDVLEMTELKKKKLFASFVFVIETTGLGYMVLDD